MKRVILLGNSENLLNTRLGSVIDTFDYVFRVNCPRVGGEYKEYVGEKITNLFLTSTPEAQRRWVDETYEKRDKWYELSRRQFEDSDAIIQHLNNKSPIVTYGKQHFITEFGYEDDFQVIDSLEEPFTLDRNILLSSTFLQKYKAEGERKKVPELEKYVKNKFDIDWSTHYISSGFLCLLLLESVYENIYIHGMYDGGNSHYWDNEFVCWSGHGIDIETGYVEKILEKGNVKRLI